MMRYILLTGILALTASSVHADEKSDELLESIQGKWQRVMERNGQQYLAVKEVGKTHETATAYKGDDVVYSHRVDITVKATEGGNVFIYDNMKITGGPNAGQDSDRNGSYLFKIVDDTMYEIQGALPGANRKPTIITWERVK